MKETTNLKLKKPEKNEYINIDDINNNMDVIDEEVAKKASASGGDISDTVITSAEEPTAEYPVPAAGDSTKVFLGKTRKFFSDIKNWMTGVCMLGQIVNNCVTDNAKLPLSAAQGKALMDLYNVLNTNQNRTAIIKAGYAQFSNIKWAASASYTCVVSDQNIKKSDILLTGIRIVGSTAENYGLRFWVDDGYISCNCTSLIAGNNTTVGFWYLLIRSAISE